MDPKDPKLLAMFREYDQRSIIPNFKLACLLGIVLMPAGFVLDYAMYPDMAMAFFKVRVLCSILIFVFLLILLTPRGQKHQRSLGVVLALLPAASIAWMIYQKQGGQSPYYAGLNLVLLVVGFVLHWTFYESLIAVSLVVTMYLAACFAYPGAIQDRGLFVSNVYFLGLTGIIVVVGNRFHTLLRLREFEARQELDTNRLMLEESNKKLVEMDQVKTRFFANISHELRTPLTLLIAPLEVLLNNPHLNLDPASTELLRTMRANAMRLLKLINDLLDLVKLESGNLEIKPEPIPFSEFVNGLIVSVRTVAEDKRLTLIGRVEEEVGVIEADRDKLEKVLLNLLFNAIKFTPSGGTVSILVEKAGTKLVIRVKDTGMGISAENLPFVFRRFWQADTSSKRKYQGTGIGLALVKELVEAHEGTVVVESASGKGTTMTLTLPYREGRLEKAADDSMAHSASTDQALPTQDEWLSSLYRRAELFPSLSALQDSMRPNDVPGARKRGIALVADDEPDMLRFLRSQLESQYQVIEAVDGAQAVEKANQYLPEIILLDMMMPEKDGLQVCRELREKTSTQSIPIVLLTARADEETKIAVLKAGANDFLSKPFSTTELHVRTRNLVDSHQLQRTLTRQNQILEATLEQLKETESQLVQSEKLASLGRMSAGIIHEINNPLNYAKTGLFTLKNKGKYMPPEQLETYVDIIKDIEEGVDRVKTIVSDLRGFTHPNMESLEECEILKLVKSALRLVGHQSQDDIEIITEIAPDLIIRCNGNKMIQVLVNLFQNAMDSMKTKKYVEETPLLRIHAQASDQKTILKIRDNGKGISSEHQGKIFEPFFTTKDVGEGMGLGLSIVYRIIQDCEGRIEVVSEAGKFCEFRLEFPAVLQKN